MTGRPNSGDQVPTRLLRVLYIDDSPNDRELVRLALAGSPFALQVTEADCEAQFISRWQSGSYDLVLTDFHILGFEGFQVLERVHARDPLLPVIIVTGTGSEEIAVEAMKRGAADYVIKTNKHLQRLPLSISAAIEKRRLKEEQARTVHQQKQVEDDLSRERNQLRTLIDNLPDCIYIKDAQGRYLVNNSANTKLLGVASEGDVLGRTVYDFFPREVAQQYEADDRLVFEQGRALINHEEPFVVGSQRGWFATTKVPLRDAHNNIVGLVGITRDVTEQKESELEHRRLASAVEQSADSILILCPNGLIQFANPAFERMTGYQREEITGLHFDWLQRGKDVPFTFAQISGTVAAGEVWTGRFTSLRKDSTRFEEEISISAIRGTQGEVADYLVISRDASKEAALEEQVRQAQKMEAVGLLAGGVAHDFNNILQIIQGFNSLALSTVKPGAPIHPFLIQVRDAAERATQLTRQLLTFGRRQSLNRSDVDLNQLALDVLKMIRRLIGEHIEIALMPGHELGNVYADKSQLEQVLLNLCVNARDAMPNGGRIIIQLRNIELEPGCQVERPWARPGRFVCLSVEDNGCGMDGETLSRIFEPFFTTKGKDKGTGLGLAVVYGIVQQHDGLLHVESELSKGSTFRVYLPVTSKGLARPQEESPTTAPLGTETLLLAEDDPAVRRLAITVLRNAGYQVLSAANGKEACSVFDANREAIELLLFDVVMPEMGGRDAYEYIKRQKPEIPAVFASGYSGTALQGGDQVAAQFELLQKPYSALRLLTIIRSVLDRAKG